MAPPLLNGARPVFYETDVTPSAGLKPNDAYDLILYPELSKPGCGILKVSMIVQFQFRDGESTAASTKGRPLTWTRSEKDEFARNFNGTCLDVWKNRFRIKTTSPLPAIRDVSVDFDIRWFIDGSHTSEHWEVAVTKADDWAQSSVNVILGNTTIDSKDVNYAEKGSLPAGPAGPGRTLYQRGAAHEFGHMLGLRDEYPAARVCIWNSDQESIMHSEEKVRPRHYAPFAAWLTEQQRPMAIRNRKPIVYRVYSLDGPPVDLSNASL